MWSTVDAPRLLLAASAHVPPPLALPATLCFFFFQPADRSDLSLSEAAGWFRCRLPLSRGQWKEPDVMRIVLHSLPPLQHRSDHTRTSASVLWSTFLFPPLPRRFSAGVFRIGDTVTAEDHFLHFCFSAHARAPFTFTAFFLLLSFWRCACHPFIGRPSPETPPTLWFVPPFRVPRNVDRRRLVKRLVWSPLTLPSFLSWEPFFSLMFCLASRA